MIVLLRLLVAAVFLCIPISAFAQKTKATLTTEINTNWPDNTTGAITPALLRSTVLDLVNSYLDVNGSSSFTCTTHQFLVSIATLSTYSCAQPAFTDISGTASAAQIPAPTASTLGGVESYVAVSHQWINTISTAGAPSSTQPATTDLSDVTSGAVTITDNSGASLSFTGVSAKFDRVGDVVHVFGSFTYPSTANGTAASIALGSVANFPSSAYGRQCVVTFANTSTALAFMLPNASAATIALYGATGTPLTNANASTGTINFTCVYPAT